MGWLERLGGVRGVRGGGWGRGGYLGAEEVVMGVHLREGRVFRKPILISVPLTKNAGAEDVDQSVYSERKPYQGVEVSHLPLHPGPSSH